MFVTEMMKTDLVAVTPETKLSEAKSLMEKGNFRHLPVMDAEGKQVGIVIDMDPLTGPNTTFWPLTIDGERVHDSTSILERLQELFPEPSLLAEDPKLAEAQRR